jgi:hypothetical protein
MMEDRFSTLRMANIYEPLGFCRGTGKFHEMRQSRPARFPPMYP